MESNIQPELDFSVPPIGPTAGRIAIKETKRQYLLDSLEALNPNLGILAACLIDQTTKELKTKDAEIIANDLYRTLIFLEETRQPTLSVLLSDRAKNLLSTLNSISRNHSLGGLDMASEPDSPYIPELLAYFNTNERGLKNIKENTSRKRPRLYRRAKLQFASSIGHTMVEESGFIEAEENDNMTTHDFIEFVKKYYITPDAQSTRDKYRRRLQKYIPKS